MAKYALFLLGVCQATESVSVHLNFFCFRMNQYPHGQAATEAVDENLSENDGEDEKKLKEAELIIENKYKEMDNKLREERGDIVLLANETDGQHEEKHQAEQKVKEKVEKETDVKIEKHEKEIKRTEDGKEGVLAKLDTQLKGILKTSDTKPSLRDESGVKIGVKDNQTGVVKPEVKGVDVDKQSAGNLHVLSVKPGRTLPQVDRLEGKGSGKPPLAVPAVSHGESAQKSQPQPGDSSSKPVSHSVKQLVKQFERDKSRERDTLELPKAFSVPENMSDNLKSSIPRRQSEPSCNIVDSSSHYPNEHLVSRAQLTFAIMQNEDRTHTMGDDNVDENATRAAPFTHASQWQGISAFASSSEESQHDDAEEVIGTDGKIHKSSKGPKGNLMNTLADEDDIRLDSIARNSVVFYDGDKDSKAGLRNSLIFIDDDIEDSPQEQLGLFIKEKVEEKSLNIDSREFSFSIPGSESRSRMLGKMDRVESESGAIVTNHLVSADNSLPSAFNNPSTINDKLAKDIGNRISAPLKYPSSPSKSSLKDKESLSDVKKLAVLNNLKLSSFGKLSGSNLRKERSSDSLDKILKEKQKENSAHGSPSKSRHLLRPLDFALREKNKSESDLAGIERKARSRTLNKEEKERGRSGSLSESKKSRRQSLSTIEEHINRVHASPTVTPVAEENPICNIEAVPSASNTSVKTEKAVTSTSNISLKNDKPVTNSSNTSVKNEKTIQSASNTSVKNDKVSEERVREKKESKRSSKKRSSSASRVEKRERELSKTLDSYQLNPVPPLELSSRVPKPPTAGSAPTRNLVYSSR